MTNTAAALGLPLSPPLIQVVLPIGVSFYTFMAISYVVDVYHRRFPLASWIDVTLYLSFFPHLVAGPIVRPEELIPQLDVRRDARHVDVVGAGWLILGGLFKKVVIANYLATAIVDQVFNEPARHGWQEILVGIVAYAVQIYCDFSGYTDIAIGIAKLLGFQFPQNFDRPYSARSIQEFWRRWHMTLSRWLRDYLYIPLGGNRKGTARTYGNLMITMLLGGSVARRGLALRRLGWAARGLPRDRSMEAVAAGAGGPGSRPGRALGVCAAGVERLRARLRCLGVLPGGLGRLGVDHAGPVVHARERHHGADHRAGAAGDRGRACHAVRSPRSGGPDQGGGLPAAADPDGRRRRR